MTRSIMAEGTLKYQNFSMIARHIGKGERQGRYYRHAAQLLGFIDNHQNYAWILPVVNTS